MNWEVTCLFCIEEECVLNGVIFAARNTYFQSLRYPESFEFFISD